MSTPHKIIITGTGRAGTTFIVRLLSALGEPTGFGPDDWRRDYSEPSHAGLEHDASDANSPYIVKNPQLCVSLAGMLQRGELIVDHAIIPVRDLATAALSRVWIGGRAEEIPGGLVGTDDPGRQQSVLAERFHQLVHTLLAHDVPHTFLLFPRFVEDADYAFRKLSPIFPHIRREAFVDAFRQIADPKLVHHYSTQHASNPSPIAEEFRRQRTRSKRARLRRRIIRWSMAVATLTIAARLAWPTADHRAEISAPVSIAKIPDDRGVQVAVARTRSWFLVGARYRTRELPYQPFGTFVPPPLPLCERASDRSPATVATALASGAAPPPYPVSEAP